MVFGRLSWGEGQDLVCYQAERSGPPSKPTILETVEYRQTWGEKLATRIDPAIFVLDIASGQIQELPTPKTICPASVFY